MHTQLIISLASNAYHHSVDNDEIHDDDEGGDNIDDDVDMDDDDDDEINDDNVHDDDDVYSFTQQSYYRDFLTFIITQSKITITIRISL